MKDLYEDFAADYDEFGDISEYIGDEKSLFEKLFNVHNVKSVLDCACGTGQHLYLFNQMGLSVCGSDYSLAMLKKANENLSKHGVEVPLKQCDFRYLEQAHDEKFDAVVCLTTSLPHLHTDEDLICALKSMRERLNDNGILVLTQGTTHNSLNKTPPIEVVVNRNDFTRVFVKEVSDGFLTIHILDIFHSEKRSESKQHDVIYRILLDDDYRRLLSSAGFSKTSVYGGYKMSEYNKDKSWRLIVVGEK